MFSLTLQPSLCSHTESRRSPSLLSLTRSSLSLSVSLSLSDLSLSAEREISLSAERERQRARARQRESGEWESREGERCRELRGTAAIERMRAEGGLEGERENERSCRCRVCTLQTAECSESTEPGCVREQRLRAV